ncbi:MAG: hypothetical protein FJ303_11765 [Planctomycetes bacterium]|nr:hypothetical protein [Planctomycetota bacterium]
MNKERLCKWLGLPTTDWPPDPWTLLGLPPGDHDAATIEERVHERMAKLRTYQLSYPEEATEGMNRLAEAFVALTESAKKKPPPETKAPAATKLANKDDTSVLDAPSQDWRDDPPPVRDEGPAAPEAIADDDAETEEVPVSQPFAPPVKHQRRLLSADQIRELAEESDEAISNLGTLDAVIARVELTRRLLYAWERVGRYLRANSKKTSPKESDLYAKRLQIIAEVMKTFPGFMGHAGRPGYRVVAQATLGLPLATVRAMNPDQREELLCDWQDGYEVLRAHRKFLRQRFKSMRHQTTVGLVMTAVRAVLNDYPRLTVACFAIALAATLVSAVLWALN